MIEAWSLRSLQRQKLLEELMHDVYEAEEKGSCKLLWLAQVIIRCLEGAGPENFDFIANIPAQLFFEHILPKIKSFVRANEESDFLLAELLKEVLGSALVPVYSALSSLEIHNSQLIFHAESAMTEVEMPEE